MQTTTELFFPCSQAQDAAGFRMTLVQTRSDQHWTQGRVITVQHLAIKLFQWTGTILFPLMVTRTFVPEGFQNDLAGKASDWSQEEELYNGF